MSDEDWIVSLHAKIKKLEAENERLQADNREWRTATARLTEPDSRICVDQILLIRELKEGLNNLRAENERLCAENRLVLENQDKDLADSEVLHRCIAELQAENERLREGIDSVADLMRNSSGVQGLHMNGDLASWDELLAGGRFEEWLIDFSAALEVKR